MKVVFCKGIFRNTLGELVQASWAETPSSILTLPAQETSGLLHLDPSTVRESEPFVALDLPGLDNETLEVVVENILRRGYLDKPGIRGKDEAILFVLVNEVLTDLDGLRRELEGDEAG